MRQGFEPVAEGESKSATPIARSARTVHSHELARRQPDRLDWTVIAVNEKGEWGNPRGTKRKPKSFLP